MARLSKTQIDRLGDRVKRGAVTDSDLRLLDEYRRSFREAYETVIQILRIQLALEPTGRSAKSTTSLIDKLRRESIRLTQVQDIAGCRIVVADITGQDRVITSICSLFPGAPVIDRRASPSHGYRAVHVIVEVAAKLVEIQIRTALQHVWAELSERVSDAIGPAIKYGGGDEQMRVVLSAASSTIATTEENLLRVARLLDRARNDEERAAIEDLREEMNRSADSLRSRLHEVILNVTRMARRQE